MERKLKVLALTRYGRLGASTRLRCLQFAPHLLSRGISIDHSPLLGDEYLQRYYSGEKLRRFADVLCPYATRIMRMLKARSYDVVWLEKEALPYVPGLLEALVSVRLPPVVIDYDDAIFHNYDLSKRAVVRHVLGHKIDRLMASARSVIAGNSYLAARAAKAGAKDIAIIPTVLDPQRYQYGQKSQQDRFRIGWVGTKSTSGYLRQVAPALARAQRELDAEVVIIGAKSVQLPEVTPTYVDWTEHTEAAEIGKLNIGIMPLSDTPWERGKCGYKLLQYMACGLPVVASPVGANTDIVVAGETGFLATDNNAWFEAFKKLRDDRKSAISMGALGRKRVETLYSITAVLPQIERCLRQAANT